MHKCTNTKSLQYFWQCTNLSSRHPNVRTSKEKPLRAKFCSGCMIKKIYQKDNNVCLPYFLGKVSFGPIFPEVKITVNPFTPERSKQWWVIEHNLETSGVQHHDRTSFTIRFPFFFVKLYYVLCAEKRSVQTIKCSSGSTESFQELYKC